jgi:hypothetical protein
MTPPVSIDLKEHQFDTLQALYAEMHELRVRMEHAQEKAAVAARACMAVAGMILRDHLYDPDEFSNLRLEKQKSGRLLLHLDPAKKD